MKGKAENWFNQYMKDDSNHIRTFDQFILALETHFGEGYDVQWHHSRLLDLVQNGSVENFNKKFDKLLENLPADYLHEDVKINTYLTQLKPKIRREVKCKRPTSVREAQRIAMIYDDQYHRNTNWEKKFIKRPRKLFRPKESDDMGIDNIAIKPNQRKKVCFNCQKEGHIEAKCPNKSNLY